jgi:hypothetical protein
VTPPRDDAVTITRCPLCASAFTPTGRQQFCSHACRQTAYRRRQPITAPTPVIPAPRARRDVTVYECDDCEQRYYAQQWCADCNRPCRRVGTGGLCPHCDGAVAIEDLTTQHTPKPITNKAAAHGASA